MTVDTLMHSTLAFCNTVALLRLVVTSMGQVVIVTNPLLATVDTIVLVKSTGHVALSRFSAFTGPLAATFRLFGLRFNFILSLPLVRLRSVDLGRGRQWQQMKKDCTPLAMLHQGNVNGQLALIIFPEIRPALICNSHP